ncbi:MAG: ABC transporter substrate-binding protein [Candidatus Weimeria sp.]|nr:ABC transporter substrate-binding protein [Candidatus Weimeria sp.]
MMMKIRKTTGLFVAISMLIMLTACSGPSMVKRNSAGPAKLSSLQLSYAKQFAVDYYEQGYVHIRIGGNADYILIPEGQKEQDLGFKKATLIHQEKARSSIYLAASSGMDLFDRLDGLSSITSCSMPAKEYVDQNVQKAITSGDIVYAGKYSAPDYEKLLGLHTGLAIESMMITHAPKIKEELTRLHIPVLVEMSSYETSPLGRLEWIKLYGVLLGKEKKAEAFFDGEVKKLKQLTKKLKERKEQGKKSPRVAIFYLSSNGYVNVRKPGDYMTKMIEMAGGEYALKDITLPNDNALSTININWEVFYQMAWDADILIYNGTIDGGITSTEHLLSKNPLFKKFYGVKHHNLWCTNLNMYQESSKMVDVTLDFYTLIEGKHRRTKFLQHMK